MDYNSEYENDEKLLSVWFYLFWFGQVSIEKPKFDNVQAKTILFERFFLLILNLLGQPEKNYHIDDKRNRKLLIPVSID